MTDGNKPRCNWPLGADTTPPGVAPEVCGKTEAQHGAKADHPFGLDYGLTAAEAVGMVGLDGEPLDPETDGEVTCYVSVSVMLEDGITRSMMWAGGADTTEGELLDAAVKHLTLFARTVQVTGRPKIVNHD